MTDPESKVVVELALPCYVGDPRTETATCPQCGGTATAEIRFVAFSVNIETREPLGTWEPAIYKCPAGHIAMESEV